MNLQRGPGADQAGPRLGGVPLLDFEGIEENAEGFEQTAAIIRNLDLVITVDTAVAHLSAAMGIPTWIALAAAADWRWMYGRDDSLWYPAARLFRQGHAGEWKPVFDRIWQALAERATSVCSNTDHRSEAQHRHGCQLMAQGDLSSAIGLLERAACERPHYAAAHQDWGVALARAGRTREAVERFRRALELDPPSAPCHANLVLALLRLKDHAATVKAACRALEMSPQSAELHYWTGLALGRLGREGESAEYLAKATSLDPNYAAAHFALGEAYRRIGDLSSAEQSYRRTLEIRPDHIDAKREIAVLTASGHCDDQALAVLRETAEARPSDATCQTALGISLMSLGRASEAAAAFQRAIYISPADPMIHLRLGEALLLQGNFQQGWLEYEWRLRSPSTRRISGVRWTGQDPAGKSLLVLSEHRPEDTLMFARFIGLAKARGFERIVVECPPQGVSLLSGFEGIDEIVPSGSSLPNCQMYCPAASLPLSLRLGENDLPNGATYVNPTTDTDSTVNGLESAGASSSNSPHIRLGIAFCKTANAFVHQQQDAILERISATCPNFVDLMKLTDSADWPSDAAMSHLQNPENASWRALAVMMRSTEAILCTDEVTAHLAGAMGIRAHLMLVKRDDWRWLSCNGSSFWYPSVSVAHIENFVDWERILQTPTNQSQS